MTPERPTLRELLTVARSGLGPRRALEVARKATHRLAGRKQRIEAASAAAWATVTASDPELLMSDVGLRTEAEEMTARLEAEAPAILESAGVRFGGGGHVTLLYYLVRQMRPQVVVETGVAAGWSSRAILEAMRVNGTGHLWSSDFPYLRQAKSESAIGCLVPDELRNRWTLLLDGDRANLPRILEACGPIEIFHYDSDKSRSGRTWAWARVSAQLADRWVGVIDDIHNDHFFADLTAGRPDDPVVLEFGGKFVGLIGSRPS